MPATLPGDATLVGPPGEHVMPASRTRALTAFVVLWASACAAQPQIWVSLTSWNGDIHLWNTATSENRLLRQGTDSRTSHCAFSNSGTKLAFAQFGGQVYTVNNDGTGLTPVCNTYTSQVVTNICWTTKGLFWNEGEAEGGTPYVYWADPYTGATRRLGPISRNVGLTSLAVSRDGSVAYARLHHESVDFAYGAVFFDIDHDATSLTNEKYDDAGEWDHGATMLNDGSAAVWTLWNCSFGNTAVSDASGCYHHAFGFVASSTSATGSFDKDRVIDWPVLHDAVSPSVPYNWQLWGPGSSPFTTPSNDSLMLYSFQEPVEPWDVRMLVVNMYTETVTDVTPPYWAFEGEFWAGQLPDPQNTFAANPAGVPTLRAPGGPTPAVEFRVTSGSGVTVEGRTLTGRQLAPRQNPTPRNLKSPINNLQ